MLQNLMPNFYFIYPEIIILLGIFLSTMFGVFSKKNKNAAGYIILITFILSIYQLLSFVDGSKIVLQDSYVISKFTQFSKIIILVCNFAVILISYSSSGHGNLPKSKSTPFEIPIIIALSTLGMFALISSNSLLMLYLGLELFSLGLYILIATNRDDSRATEASLKYFILGAISSGILLFGSSLVYGNMGTINFEQINLLYSNYFCTKSCLDGQSQNLLLLVGFILIIVAMMFKLSLFPFHNWTPDVYEGARSSIVVLLASSAKYAALVILIRLVFESLINIKDQLQQVLILVSILSVLFGNIIAVVQTNIKRLLGYSAIGNMGFILMSIVPYNKDLLKYTVFYAIAYITQILTIFALLAILGAKTKFKSKIDDLKGLHKNNPFMALSFTAILFSMAGIPPLAGFFAKLYVFKSLIESGIYYLCFVGVLATVIGCFYYINIIRKIYFDKPEKDNLIPKIRLSTADVVVIFLGLIFNILYVLIPSTILEIISKYVIL